MSERILESLEPVRRRQLWLEIFRCSAIGLLAGSLCGGRSWLCFAGRDCGRNADGLGAACLAGGPLIGALFGLLRGRSIHLAQPRVDRCYGLKDRAATAIDFIRRGQPTPVHVLQVADAERHLAGIDARRVAPYRIPRVMPYALAADRPGARALALAAVGTRSTPSRPSRSSPFSQAAIEAEESLEDLAGSREKGKRPQAQGSRPEAQRDDPGNEAAGRGHQGSPGQALGNAGRDHGPAGPVQRRAGRRPDAGLGEAMASTQALEGAGQALQQGKYDKAAEQLEKAEPKFDRKEAKTLKEKLAKAAKAMEDAGLADLSTATTELSEAMEDAGVAAGACKKLGNLARSQGRRKKINDLLTLQCRNLGECKGNCQKNSTAKLRLRKKSDKPKSTWGMATSGNTDGELTKLDSARQKEQVKGEMGEGASETETTHMPEGRQAAARAYREQYQKYRRMTEAALDSEPIPLGHRQTIRRYFELIRPQGDEADKAAAPAAGAEKPQP